MTTTSFPLNLTSHGSLFFVFVLLPAVTRDQRTISNTPFLVDGLGSPCRHAPPSDAALGLRHMQSGGAVHALQGGRRRRSNAPEGLSLARALPISTIVHFVF